MMLLLGAIALWLRHHLNRQPATVACNTGGGNLYNSYPAVIIPAGYSGDVMQELISQIAALGNRNNSHPLADDYLRHYLVHRRGRASDIAQSGPARI